MAVPLFNETGNLTLIDLADTGTNWLPADVDIDIKVEGVGAGFDAIRNGGTVTYSFPAAVDMSAAGTHVRVWFQHTFPSYLETKALGGIQLVVSTGNSDNIYYVSGSDQHKGTWELLQADLASPDINGGANLASIDAFSITIAHATAARNVANTYWDVSWFGTGIEFYGGTNIDKVAWETLYQADTALTTSKQYGIIERIKGGAIYLNHAILIGDSATTNDCYFDGTNETIVFYSANEALNTYKIQGTGNATGTTDIDLSGAVITSSGTKWTLDMTSANVTSFTMNGGSLGNTSSILLKTGQTLDTVNISSSDSIIPNGGLLDSCSISNSLVTGSLSEIQNCSLSSPRL